MIVQGTAEWHQERLGKATASKIADIIARTKTGYGAGRANYAAQLIAERLTGTPTEGFTQKAVSGELGAALDIAAGLAGRPGPGYIAKLSKGFLGFTRKLGMTQEAATKLAVAVTRRDPKAMRQIIAAVARNGAEQKQLASLIRQAMQAMTNSEE